MLHVESQKIIDQVKDLYPSWEPTATQMEAISHKLICFQRADARQAVLDSYDPTKRTAPVQAIFAACRKIVADRKQQAQQIETAAAGPVFTTDDLDTMYRRRAEKGDAFALEMCRRRGIEVNDHEAVAF